MPLYPRQGSAKRVFGWAAVVTGLLLASVVSRSCGGTYTQILLSVAVVGAAVLVARFHLAALGLFPRAARFGLLVTAVCPTCGFLLVWTSLRSDLFLWRVTWVLLIAAITSTYILSFVAVDFGRRSVLKTAVVGCGATLGLMLAYPAVADAFPSFPGAAYFWAMSAPAVGTFFGPAAMRRWPANEELRISGPSPPRRARRLCLSHVALVVIGLCIGRASAPHRGVFAVQPYILANLTHKELSTQVKADFVRLRELDADVTDLIDDMEVRQREFDAAFSAAQRDYYLPHEGAQMRLMFREFLSQRASLQGIASGYAGLESIRNTKLRARCFTVSLAAAMMLYESNLKIVLMHRDSPIARQKLDERQPQHGIDAGMFTGIYEYVVAETASNSRERMAGEFVRQKAAWRDAKVWPRSDWDWLDTRIAETLDYVRENRIDHQAATVDLFLERLGDQAYQPILEVQSTVAEWMGDTRIVEQPAPIESHQIKRMETELRPGDIVLQRREWYLGNAFLPGFWSHAALYIGRIEDLRSLGIADHPTVRAHLSAYLVPALDGADRTLIEAVSEGVVFSSIMETLHADHVVVLRPRLSKDQIARAIVKAFEYHGRPYDFDFDLATADKVVCTELVYRAYEGALHFDPVRMLGRYTLPAAEIAKKFVRERGHAEPQLEFLFFYETTPSVPYAKRSTEQAFLATTVSPSYMGDWTSDLGL